MTHGAPDVLVIQEYIPEYRAEFFEGLRRALGQRELTVKIATSGAGALQKLRNDRAEFVPDYRLRSIHLMAGGRRVVLRSLSPGWLSAGTVVLEHSVKYLDHFITLSLRRMLRRPTLLWGHGYTITESQSSLQRRLQHWQVKLSSGYLAYTPGSGLRAMSMGASIDRVVVLMNTIPGAPTPGALLKTSASNWRAVYVGGLDSSKKIDELFAIARAVHAVRPEFRLTVAGDGELREAVIDQCKSEWCVYVGRIGQAGKDALASETEIILNPGRVGLIAVDSFRMAAPIVTLASQYHAPEFEYLTSENSVVCRDVEDAVARVVQLMDDADELRKLQHVAYARARELTLENMIDRFAAGVQASMRAYNRKASI